MKMSSLKFFLLFGFLFFMATMLATGKVLPPEETAITAGSP